MRFVLPCTSDDSRYGFIYLPRFDLLKQVKKKRMSVFQCLCCVLHAMPIWIWVLIQSTMINQLIFVISCSFFHSCFCLCRSFYMSKWWSSVGCALNERKNETLLSAYVPFTKLLNYVWPRHNRMQWPVYFDFYLSPLHTLDHCSRN